MDVLDVAHDPLCLLFRVAVIFVSLSVFSMSTKRLNVGPLCVLLAQALSADDFVATDALSSSCPSCPSRFQAKDC